jgi:hypothetical protein
MALLAATALALGACGQRNEDTADDFQGEQRLVAQAVEDLQSAGRKGDEEKICNELLAPALARQVARGAGTCANALEDRISDVDVFGLEVQRVRVTGDRATAVVQTDGGDPDQTYNLALQRVNGVWKLASLG